MSYLIRSLAFAGLSLILSASPADAEALKSVHVVDMQKVINDSIAGKAARNDMEGEIKKKEGALQKMQNDLKSMKEDLDKQSALLSADALKGKQDTFAKKEREFQRAFQDNREDLGKRNNEAIGKIVKEIDAIIKDLAASKGYQLVVEKDTRFVIYADPEFDITDQVIKALDSKKLD